MKHSLAKPNWMCVRSLLDPHWCRSRLLSELWGSRAMGALCCSRGCHPSRAPSLPGLHHRRTEHHREPSGPPLSATRDTFSGAPAERAIIAHCQVRLLIPPWHPSGFPNPFSPTTCLSYLPGGVTAPLPGPSRTPAAPPRCTMGFPDPRAGLHGLLTQPIGRPLPGISFYRPTRPYRHMSRVSSSTTTHASRTRCPVPPPDLSDRSTACRLSPLDGVQF